MNTFPSVDESYDRLHQAGWSVGDGGTAAGWRVSGSNGENLLEARGRTQAEAWWRACEQARALGMLACKHRHPPSLRHDFVIGTCRPRNAKGTLPSSTAPPARRHPRVGDVRGKGLLACLELVRDRTSHAPLVPANADSPLPLQVRRRAWDEGLHVMARGSLILVAPP